MKDNIEKILPAPGRIQKIKSPIRWIAGNLMPPNEKEKTLATSLKQVRWSELDEQGRARQFTDRGIERTARNEIRSTCDFCSNTITEGNKYFDINGAKYAHEACVTARSGSQPKHRIVTHKMVEEKAKDKTPQLAVVSKRGRKPKSEAAASPAGKAAKRGRKPKNSQATVFSAAMPAKRGRKPGSKAAAQVASQPVRRGRKPGSKNVAAQPTINLSEVREALPGAIVTLTITGTVEAVQRALDKLQN